MKTVIVQFKSGIGKKYDIIILDGGDIMNKHEFTKYEVATYLRDYNRTMTYAIMNQDIPFYEVFKHHMHVDGRIQYAIKDYYYEMISIYEILLLSKFYTVMYDNYFDNLLESSIDKISIPDSVFINNNDRSKFSNKQIIKFIRNALNHNDNPTHDLAKFIRINEDEKEKIKVEILLRNTKPIPFHVMLDINELISICFEIKNANSIIIASNRSTRPISLNSSNVNETLNNMFLRKFFARKKLTDGQKEAIISHINSGNKTNNYEKFFLENGMEYKDIQYSIAQKIKIEEDLKYWESLGESGNNVISHLLDKVMPFSWSKDRVLTMNLILSNYYMRDGKSTIFDLVKDARQIYQSNNLNEDHPLNLYGKSFGIDDNILYDSIDFENLLSITNAIYYGYIFDTLVTDNEVKITDSKTIEREKIRDSFVHMRWYKGVNECFKLFDWDNGIDNEYNPNSPDFWKYNIRYKDMANCAESYFQRILKTQINVNGYMDSPIHFKKNFLEDGTSVITGISFIKNGVFYYLDLNNNNQDLELLICDSSQIQRLANEDEKRLFISELDNLSEKEKNDFSSIIEKLKNKLIQHNKNSNIKK